MIERLVPLGELVATHGIKGWLKLKPYNPRTTTLAPPREVFLTTGPVCSTHLLQQSKAFKRLFLVKLQGLDGIAAAEKWIGSVLSVEEKELQALQPGEYYYYQILGFDVFDAAGHRVGTITRVWSKEGGDLYVVKGPAKEHLIPAVRAIIDKIDFAARKVIINPPEGLLEL